jgi:DNA-binding NarL/FixJ family response regulator
MQIANESEHPIRILLVDDHKSMLWGLERLIESEHPRMQVVGKASSRAELFAALPNAMPDIILLDLDLNGENGLDFLEDILKQSQAQVLILTAMQDPMVHQRAILGGANGVVLKSENAEVILRAIQRVHAGEVWLNRSTTSRMLKGMNTHPSPSDNLNAKKIATLTPKELQIIAAMALKPGAHNKAVASQLAMSEHTLRNHLTEIYAKLELENRLELVMFAIEHKLSSH